MRRVTAVVSFLALIFISCNNIEESAMDLPDVHNLTFGNIETDLPAPEKSVSGTGLPASTEGQGRLSRIWVIILAVALAAAGGG